MNDRILITPNLPHSKVTAAAIGEKYKDTAKELTELGITPILIKMNPFLDEETCSHADMLLFQKNSTSFVVSKEQKSAAEYLTGRGANVKFEDNVAAPYPNDVKLNAVIIGSKIICNKKYVSKRIYESAEKNKKEIINTKQGYSKCSICLINEKAVITEDAGLYTLLKNCQVDVLKIQPGYVYLSEKHSGFLGGASGLINKNTIFFNGNIEQHPDYIQIAEFLRKHGIKSIYNKSKRLTDIGSILPLCESLT